MDCCRLENALGVFLPNRKAAGTSGGLCQRSTVNGQLTPDAGHLALNVRPPGRPGRAPLRVAPTALGSVGIRGLSLAGRPACGPCGVGGDISPAIAGTELSGNPFPTVTPVVRCFLSSESPHFHHENSPSSSGEFPHFQRDHLDAVLTSASCRMSACSMR